MTGADTPLSDEQNHHETEETPSQLASPGPAPVTVLTDPPAEMLATQVAESLQALQTLTQLALAEAGARDEARRQIGKLAAGLIDLAGRSGATLENDQPLKLAWETLAERLAGLVPEVASDPLAGAGLEASASTLETPSPEEISKNTATPLSDKILHRVIIASLEANGETAQHIRLAAQGFSSDQWQMTNLGTNVPIMALTGTVTEMRPAVLALILNQGQLISETIRLIADLKKRLPNLRVITLGAALANPNLADRLKADLYSAEPAKAAELAAQFFDPLSRLGDRLKLVVELPEPAEAAPATPQFSKKAEG
jgi:hypothetical protein